MKIFTKDNFYTALVLTVVLGGLMLAAAHTRPSKTAALTPRDAGSAYISTLADTKELEARHITDIRVLCEQGPSDRVMRVQVAYRKDGIPNTVQTEKTCRNQGEEMRLVAKPSGWEVSSATGYDKDVYADVVRFVRKDSSAKL